MPRPTLAVYLFGYNLNRICYPWQASLRSALALAEQVYFCECHSQDDTYACLMDTFKPEIDDDRLVVVRHPWGDYHDVQAKIANLLLDRIGHRQEFALKLDADEVLCEWSFPEFAGDLRYMKAAGYGLGKPRYVHFCPDDKTTFPFIYDSKAVICYTFANRRFYLGKGQDACALAGEPEFPTQLLIHHYGKMHLGRRAAALSKEHEFQKLYVDLGFPDPKVEAQLMKPEEFDYLKVFDVALNAGEFKPYTGPHPQFVTAWLEERRQAETSRG